MPRLRSYTLLARVSISIHICLPAGQFAQSFHDILLLGGNVYVFAGVSSILDVRFVCTVDGIPIPEGNVYSFLLVILICGGVIRA